MRKIDQMKQVKHLLYAGSVTHIITFLVLCSTPPVPVENISIANPDLEALITYYYEPSDEEDDYIRGMSKEAFESQINRAQSYLNELTTTINYDELNTADQVDYEYFHAQLDNTVLNLAVLRWWENDPSMYLPFGSFYRPSLDQTKPWDDRIAAMTAGFNDVEMNFQWARENLKNPPILWVEQSIGYCDRIEQYLTTWLPKIASNTQYPELKDGLLAASTRFNGQLSMFRTYLDTDLRKRASHSLPRVSVENYNRLLKNKFLDYTIEELLEIGTRVHEETRQHLIETARSIDPDKSWLEIHQEHSLDFPPPWKLHSWLQKEANRAKTLVYDKIVNVPPGLEEEYRYTEAGHYRNLYRMGFGIGPSVFIGDKYIGYYDLPTTQQFDTWDKKAGLMLDWSRGWAIAQQIPHEVYPGHHFQSYMQQFNKRPLRRNAENAPFGEGWGVYAEDLMYDMGYIQDNPRYLLAHYQNRFWRTARIVVDVSYHTGRMDFQDVVDFFLDAGLPHEGAIFEATVVAKRATRELSYYIGKLEIEELVNDFKEMKGTAFNQKEFFTKLLLLGGTPPQLARRELFEEFELNN